MAAVGPTVSRPIRIAAIMTCHDRRPLTLRCLESLGVSRKHASNLVDLHVYLVDDGCTDGTAEAVVSRFPNVTVIAGNGHLYWCGGMRLAWASAAHDVKHDFYLWLNDDVQLDPECLGTLLETATHLREENGRAGIVVGATRDDIRRDTSYGEMGVDGVRPAGDVARPIECFNGNIVLVPAEVFRAVGNLSRAYSHGFGDIDYAIRARRRGVPIWLAPGHVGSCAANRGSRWERRDMPVLKRLIAMHRPTGCPPWELAFITLRHGGWWFPYTVAKLYWRAIFASASADIAGVHPET